MVTIQFLIGTFHQCQILMAKFIILDKECHSMGDRSILYQCNP